ncbi:anti-sigma factor family protein [Polaromonas sp. YR568]|uniref:anti-sigma factor family protein n=1 Tax=Polaromonas sp. YR568 TaxID=1855301 RepID=UPI00398BF55D
MEKIKLTSSSNGGGAPVTESDLHGYVDLQLTPARRAEVEHYLDERPDERRRVQQWQQQNDLLRGSLDPVLEEALPARLPLKPPATVYPWRGLAAGIAIAAVSASSAWFVRGSVDGEAARLALARASSMVAAGNSELTGFARRAAVAHVVYSPDIRRPVEVGADQEQQLVTWLSRRLGTAVKPPVLQGIGYELIGGRLLPGDTGPVAQFMYHDATGQRLTLYVTREVPKIANQPETAFRFGQDGPVNVFYWVDRNFGYAISGGADRKELMRVSQEVHRQLASS